RSSRSRSLELLIGVNKSSAGSPVGQRAKTSGLAQSSTTALIVWPVVGVLGVSNDLTPTLSWSRFVLTPLVPSDSAMYRHAADSWAAGVAVSGFVTVVMPRLFRYLA